MSKISKNCVHIYYPDPERKTGLDHNVASFLRSVLIFFHATFYVEIDKYVGKIDNWIYKDHTVDTKFHSKVVQKP